MRLLTFAIGLTATISSLNSLASTYVPFPVDLKPLERHAALAAEWEQLKEENKDKVWPEPALKRQFEIIESISAREPEWIDGLWMVADTAFQLGGSYSEEKDLPFARSVLVRGQKSAEKCLKRQPDHVICKLFLGAMIGKIASIDGIFSALKQAKLVESLWLDVTKSKYNHRFSESSSLQGAARYALGMFYRLVPDFFLMKWLFGVSGSLEKSIAYHRDAIAIDPPNACSRVMLAVSLLCTSGGKSGSPQTKEGLKQLAEAKRTPPRSAVAQACYKDIDRLVADTNLACGYETSRQQKTSEEDFKKEQNKSQN